MLLEQWRPVVGFEQYYAVSNLGNVKRIKASTGTRVGKLIKPWSDKDHRPTVTLSVRCQTVKRLVSRLVCTAWHGLAPTKQHQAAHWDGDSSNNREDNLRWATQAENEQDKRRHGRWNHSSIGSKHKDAKLHEIDIPIIKNLRKNGWSGPKLAKHFKVDNKTIYAVLNGKAWKHV